eukprot:TRINITY_DN1917_c0_g1_i1.p1 TRINITY_DN1917_c0_g1~~TRINITY_DN1917_c0_g1_i1.p1  ORF type:complete len:650 (+),score=176.30 TRINITY_DN1917_c0_g1_i1:36-1952(+)
MNCCGLGNRVAPEGDSKYDNVAKVVQERKCTDTFCLILFICFWGGMFAVGIVGLMRGAPIRMVYPEDQNGQTCGIDNTVYQGSNGTDMTKKPYLYLPNPTSKTFQICVDKCPAAGSIGDSFQVLPGCNYTEMICDYGETANYVTYIKRKCMCPYKTKVYLRRCVPNVDTSSSTPKNETAAAEAATASANEQPLAYTLFGDVVTVWWWLLITCFITVLIAFAYLAFLRAFAGIITWGTIIGIILVFAAFAAYLNAEAGAMTAEAAATGDSSKTTNAEIVQIMAYVFAGIAVVIFFVVVWLRRRIQLAVELVKEASRAMRDMNEILYFPFILFGVYLVFLAYWVLVSIYLASAKVYNPNSGSFEYDTTMQYMIIYHFFGFLWTTNFVIAVGYLTIAGAIASWYWTVNKEELEDGQVMKAFHRTWRYHLGSAAYGSLIIAIIQFLRACLEYIEREIKEKGLDENPVWGRVIKFVLCCLKSCFWCLEKFMKFINKNAYIIVASEGKSFCTAAFKAFHLILDNILRVAAVNMVAPLLLGLGKWMIVGITALISAIVLRAQSDLRFWLVPWFISVLMAYAITVLFMMVYDLSIDTMLLLFCADQEMYEKKVTNQLYCSDTLAEFVDGERKNREDSGTSDGKKCC